MLCNKIRGYNFGGIIDWKHLIGYLLLHTRITCTENAIATLL